MRDCIDKGLLPCETHPLQKGHSAQPSSRPKEEAKKTGFLSTSSLLMIVLSWWSCINLLDRRSWEPWDLQNVHQKQEKGDRGEGHNCVWGRVALSECLFGSKLLFNLSRYCGAHVSRIKFIFLHLSVINIIFKILNNSMRCEMSQFLKCNPLDATKCSLRIFVRVWINPSTITISKPSGIKSVVFTELIASLVNICCFNTIDH